MGNLSRAIFDRVQRSSLYPHIWFCRGPFKIYEYLAMVRGVDFRPGDVILDVGCGAGLQTNLFGRRAKKIIGIDIDENPVRRALSERPLVEGRINSEFRVTSIEQAGFADAMFDKAFSVCVIEHIPDHMSALRQINRVLKPGGTFVFTADALATIDDAELKAQHAEKYAVQRYFEPAALRADLVSAGFRDIQVSYIFRSDYARRLFMHAIRVNFQFRYSEAVILSWLLRISDFFTPRNAPGIFLLVRCRK